MILFSAKSITFDLFSNLTTNQRKNLQEIHKVASERDARKLNDQDMININGKLTNIRDELSKLNDEKELLKNNMQETSEKLKKTRKYYRLATKRFI
jgi:predicted  nucleic acid-binding Zn-ribbon protein